MAAWTKVIYKGVTVLLWFINIIVTYKTLSNIPWLLTSNSINEAFYFLVQAEPLVGITCQT